MGAVPEMPEYRCHKKVWALKINAIFNPPPDAPPGSWALEVCDKGYTPVTVSAAYMAKHLPKPGGYYVRYADGYESYSPAHVFEEGYTRIEATEFANPQNVRPIRGDIPPRRELKWQDLRQDPLCQKSLRIFAIGALGEGGDNSDYVIDYPNAHKGHTIAFQNGPIKEVGVNGVTMEALLAIVIDRLTSLQAGRFACPENGAALGACHAALAMLNLRTANRIARGVEGSYKA